MTDGGFYDRTPTRNGDGVLRYQTPEDIATEDAVAREIEQCWGVTLRRFAAFAAIDWFAVRREQVVGVLELKARSHACGAFPTVFLAVRKWLALQLACAGLGVAGAFVVRFTDGVRWVPLGEIDAGRVRVAGCGQARATKADSQQEPVIEVPVAQLRPLERKERGA